MNKQLFIIAGAAGDIGSEYCKKIIENNIDCIGIVRTKKVCIQSNYFQEIICNLDDEAEIEKTFSKIDFSQYSQITYFHTIGVDKFDPRGYPHIKPMKTIDPEVYNTNVNSFKYLLKFCINKINNINLKNKNNEIKFQIAILAGIGDKYTPFVIESFCEAKFIIRQYIQSYINLYPDWVSGLSINISSTITQSALRVRPYADTEFWLKPREVVDQSYKKLISDYNSFEDLDIMKYSPHFMKDYYRNNQLLYDKWSKETGIK